jgi:lambda family phage portal protein
MSLMTANTQDTKHPVHLSSLRGVAFRRVQGRFDSAATTHDNRRHWANADGLSADAAGTPEVRRILRNRARYEVANNSYARGIVLTLANDTVGTGPRLQMLSGNDEVNRRVEQDFTAWASETRLAEKLRTMRMSRAQDGEAFAILSTNPRIDHPVQLDLRLVEADQVTSPLSMLPTENELDGVLLDDWGNPVGYRVLRHHPGDRLARDVDEYIVCPASHVIHAFRQERPGQHRGIPEITPALPLFAQLRRYTLAVLSAAEAAADFAGILYTDAPPNGEADAVEPMDPVELERNTLLTMPYGWKMAQIDPMQPSTTYGEFKHEILNEIARCLNMPFNVAAGNSSGYNYASGRLDHQTYYKSIRVDQDFMARAVLDRVLSAWLWEYAMEFGFLRVSGALCAAGSQGNARWLPPHQWFWDGLEHVDPAKEAQAQERRLKNRTTTLAHEYARQGKDWESELRQIAREQSLMRDLGLTESQTVPAARNKDEDDG